MKLNIKTNDLYDLLDITRNCASNNKMLPITCMTCLETVNGFLQATTTTLSDYCVARVPCESTDFYAVIGHDTFYKLLSKLTCENISLEVVNQHLVVTGNGKYTLDLPVDENGELIKFPRPNYHTVDIKGELTDEQLQIIHTTNRANLSNSLAEPCYTGYYIGEQILTSDRSVICASLFNIFDTPILINDRVMYTLEGDVSIGINDMNEVIFFGKNYEVYTKSMECVDDFNAIDIMTLVNTDLDFKCSISKVELLAVLDRLSLFVSAYDKNCLAVNITSSKLTLSNLKDNSTESIAVKAGGNYKFNVDIEVFRKQVNALNEDVFELQYGSDMFIKLITDKLVEIIPLLVE